MYFYVHCLALEGLLAERLAEKTHVVEVSPCIIDDVKAVGTGLVPRKAHAQAVAHVCEVFASMHVVAPSDEAKVEQRGAHRPVVVDLVGSTEVEGHTYEI